MNDRVMVSFDEYLGTCARGVSEFAFFSRAFGALGLGPVSRAGARLTSRLPMVSGPRCRGPMWESPMEETHARRAPPEECGLSLVSALPGAGIHWSCYPLMSMAGSESAPRLVAVVFLSTDTRALLYLCAGCIGTTRRRHRRHRGWRRTGDAVESSDARRHTWPPRTHGLQLLLGDLSRRFPRLPEGKTSARASRPARPACEEPRHLVLGPLGSWLSLSAACGLLARSSHLTRVVPVARSLSWLSISPSLTAQARRLGFSVEMSAEATHRRDGVIDAAHR